jgi:DNA-binding MarR family transcriptional regulator
MACHDKTPFAITRLSKERAHANSKRIGLPPRLDLPHFSAMMRLVNHWDPIIMLLATGKKATKMNGDVRRVLDAIRRIVRVLRLASREAEKRLGLSAAQLFVLQKLAEGGVLSVNELAQRTHTHQSSVSVVVQRLVKRGMVDRTRSRADARQAEVEVTLAGKSALKSAPTAAQDRIIGALGRMNSRQVRQLADSMELLTGEIGIDGQAAAPMLFEEDIPKRKRK